MNQKHSDLIQTLDLVYIRSRFRMNLDRLYLPETWIKRLLAVAKSFSSVGVYKPSLLFLNLQDLMAATLQSMEYAYLHMRTIQWYLKHHWNHVTHALDHQICSKRIGGGQTGSTCPSECHLHYTTPTSLSLPIQAWRGGAAKAKCQGWPRHSTAPSGQRQNANST